MMNGVELREQKLIERQKNLSKEMLDFEKMLDSLSEEEMIKMSKELDKEIYKNFDKLFDSFKVH